MKNLTTPKYNFDQEIEFKYLEWMFERTKSFLIVRGLIVIGVIIFLWCVIVVILRIPRIWVVYIF